MSYVADLHLHSPFSRGTSKQLTLENQSRWAKIKGIDLLSSADFTHPTWFQETRTKLRETGDGLFEYDGVLFILGTEVNCIAEQDGRSRRVHILLFAPSFQTMEHINTALAGRGALSSDGRPILHISPRDLLRILLDIDSRCLLIPAHLWTPWYGLYGSKSGFDSLDECFGDLAGHVYAVETGLSSDPAMNWRVPSLDDLSIVSFSDAHSLPNLGRELTVLPGEPTYDGLVESLKTQSIEYTVEFFPEEGKYHHSGHRNCGVRYSPHEVSRNGQTCPKCGKRLTLGVMQRVDELSGRNVKTSTDPDGLVRGDNGRPPFKNLVSLRQIISEALDSGPDTKKAKTLYDKLVSQFGNELSVLTDAPPPDVGAVAGDRVAEGVARVRARDILIEPGYDGLYGTVKVFPE